MTLFSLNRLTETTKLSKDGITKTIDTDYRYADQEIHTLNGAKSYHNLELTITTVNGTIKSQTYTDTSGNTVWEKTS